MSLESIRDLEERIESGEIPRHKARGFLDSLYARLKRGDFYKESPEAVQAAVELLDKFGYQTHSRKLARQLPNLEAGKEALEALELVAKGIARPSRLSFRKEQLEKGVEIGAITQEVVDAAVRRYDDRNALNVLERLRQRITFYNFPDTRATLDGAVERGVILQAELDDTLEANRSRNPRHTNLGRQRYRRILELVKMGIPETCNKGRGRFDEPPEYAEEQIWIGVRRGDITIHEAGEALRGYEDFHSLEVLERVRAGRLKYSCVEEILARGVERGLYAQDDVNEARETGKDRYAAKTLYWVKRGACNPNFEHVKPTLLWGLERGVFTQEQHDSSVISWEDKESVKFLDDAPNLAREARHFRNSPITNYIVSAIERGAERGLYEAQKAQEAIALLKKAS